MKNAPKPQVIRRRGYRPPAYRIVASELQLDLDFANTRVRARHIVRRCGRATKLALDMEAMQVVSVAIDGARLNKKQYRLKDRQLVISEAPAEFELTIENTICPAENTALSGLYQSGDMLCTQCEAEGFRRITPAIDRPDNLGEYTVTLRADKEAFPVLLCNGNLIASGDCKPDKKYPGARHFATWHDPHPKPTYLFAIVAGRLDCMQDSFVTCNGREVALRFYARAGDLPQCAFAMAALKRAMKWDEERYGREYDLDLFNVVAVGDFNMGAMENKSLNIFNTACVLADAATATDGDFENVEAVVGHEYFHNWSGNRVTCRDWFQLSLKEGFTVFREQQFAADMGAAAVKRIGDVVALRAHQFREDAGPMAHAVRPDSYIEINNFYTATVYEKGAEVIRMLHTLLGEEAFRRGADLYFERHDGEAVTIDDFLAAMADASGRDLRRFERWYDQFGTPLVKVQTSYDLERGEFYVALLQSCKPTPKQKRAKPFVIPVRAALFDADGNRLPVWLECEYGANFEQLPTQADDGQHSRGDTLLQLYKPVQTFVLRGDFSALTTPPVLSLLRGFSAPVEVEYRQDDAALALLLANEDDAFSRWEAGQKLFLRRILAAMETMHGGGETAVDGLLHDAFAEVLAADADAALCAELLTPPGQNYICERLDEIDPHLVFAARREVRRQLAARNGDALWDKYRSLQKQNDGGVNARQIAGRSLRDVCLGYLALLDDAAVHEAAAGQLRDAKCMTDAVAALQVLADSSAAMREELLAEFYARWKDRPLVVDKWLRVQAGAARDGALTRVKELTAHAAFDAGNPNKVYALLGGFAGNPPGFHAVDGGGYRFIREWVAKLDASNPQVAARLAGNFSNWKKYCPALREGMKGELEALAGLALSRDVGEVVGKSLG